MQRPMPEWARFVRIDTVMYNWPIFISMQQILKEVTKEPYFAAYSMSTIWDKLDEKMQFALEIAYIATLEPKE